MSTQWLLGAMHGAARSSVRKTSQGWLALIVVALVAAGYETSSPMFAPEDALEFPQELHECVLADREEGERALYALNDSTTVEHAFAYLESPRGKKWCNLAEKQTESSVVNDLSLPELREADDLRSVTLYHTHPPIGREVYAHTPSSPDLAWFARMAALFRRDGERWVEDLDFRVLTPAGTYVFEIEHDPKRGQRLPPRWLQQTRKSLEHASEGPEPTLRLRERSLGGYQRLGEELADLLTNEHRKVRYRPRPSP